MKFSKKFISDLRPLFLHRAFARVSPVFVLGAAALFAAPNSLFASSNHASGNSAEPSTATVKRDAAEAQYSKAEEARALLNAKSADKRTLAEYKAAVASYKKVYLISPHASDVQDSLLAVGELYSEMGDRFGRTYYQSAVESYQFLLKEYPRSKFAQDVPRIPEALSALDSPKRSSASNERTCAVARRASYGQ
jgi:tetratricopeptide (TPR) repeat protein